MYLKEIEIENIGPIDNFNIKLSFYENNNPKPLVLIGQNGSGKSIVISYIVNAIIAAKQIIYDDNEVEKGKVFKYRSPKYVKSGKLYSRSKITFEEEFSLLEWQLLEKKSEFEINQKFTPYNKEWKLIDKNETSLFHETFSIKIPELKNLIDNNCLLFFPPNRFEEPGWLNYDNLNNKINFRFLRRMSNHSERFIINYAPLKDNQNWLLDVIFDEYVLDLKTNTILLDTQQNNKEIKRVEIIDGYEGKSHTIHEEVIKFLNQLFQTDETIRFGISQRRLRGISIIKNEKQWIPNIFNLSTGESILLNIFLTIIKDFDLSDAKFKDLSEIRGVVIIDEVDIHLHSNLQYTVLPQLIKMFPKIQFILTSHSPLFLLGLQKELGDNNFQIINLPDGLDVNIENYKEFEDAYNCFKDSLKFKEDIKKEIKKSKIDYLFVEGIYDVKYIKKAALLLNKENVLNFFQISDSNGFGGLDKIYKNFNSKLSEIISQKILLLYDCDINKSDAKKENIYKKIIPLININPIKKGIENLFPESTINKIRSIKPMFFDITQETKKIIRGENVTIPECLEVNENEKGNLCDWIIENGTKEDFSYFEKIFDILNEIKNEPTIGSLKVNI